MQNINTKKEAWSFMKSFVRGFIFVYLAFLSGTSAQAVIDYEGIVKEAFHKEYREVFLDALGKSIIDIHLEDAELKDVHREKFRQYLEEKISSIVEKATEEVSKKSEDLKELSEFTLVAEEIFVREYRKIISDIHSYKIELQTSENTFQSCYGTVVN